MKYFLFLLLVFFSSCRTQQGFFQESSLETYYPTSNSRISTAPIAPLEKKDLKIKAVKKSLPKIEQKEVYLPIPISKETLNDTFQEKHLEVIAPTPNESYFLPQIEKDEKPKKKNNNKFRQVSFNVFIGFFFLGLAILLAILELGSLSILFALASIIFLYLGFKKLWKKRRRKQRFKDIFN